MKWMLIFVGVLLGIATLFYFQPGKLMVYSPLEVQAPGLMISVGTHQLHLYCVGSGSPTAILESGLGDWSLNWMTMQERIAERFDIRVCTYDRAGYGWSEAAPTSRSVENLVGDLHTLIERSDIEGPMLLIGHSLGGLVTRVFASQYPENVAGVILLDATPPAFRPSEDQQANLDNWISWMRSQRDALNENGIPANLRAALPASQIPPSVPEDFHDTWRSQFMQLETFDVMIAEFEVNGPDAREQYADLGWGDAPLYVIARDTSPDATEEVQARYEVWIELQQAQAEISVNGRFEVASEAGHYIHVMRPDYVLGLIGEMLAEIGGRSN